VLDRPPLAAPPRLAVTILLSLLFLPGCGRSSPTAPASAGPTVSGYVYEVMLPGSGEPPIADVLITVTDDTGEATTGKTDGAGFYSVGAATGTVVVTASKDGYKSRQARFDVTDSTVLNFALRPTSD
jgi:hypothetical protein